MIVKDTVWTTGDVDDLIAAIDNKAPLTMQDGTATIYLPGGLSVIINVGNRIRLHDDDRIEVLAA